MGRSSERKEFGGSVCGSNTPTTSRRCRPPVLKTGRITGSHALPLKVNCSVGKLRAVVVGKTEKKTLRAEGTEITEGFTDSLVEGCW